MGRETKQTLSSLGFSYRKSKVRLVLRPWCPQSPGREGGGQESAGLEFGSLWTSGSSFCRQRRNEDDFVWILSARIVQQFSPLPSKERRQEMVKANLHCAFPDRLCLILPPRSNRPSPPAFLLFLSTPLPLSYY